MIIFNREIDANIVYSIPPGKEMGIPDEFKKRAEERRGYPLNRRTVTYLPHYDRKGRYNKRRYDTKRVPQASRKTQFRGTCQGNRIVQRG